MEKVDNLFIIIGANPMPNIITITNRAKEDGKVYFIHTNEEEENSFGTQNIANNIQEMIKESMQELKIECVSVNKNSENNILEEVELRYEEIKGTIELNYTGGTKLMSSSIYKFFKQKMIDGNKRIRISYFDGINGYFVVEDYKNQYREEKFNLENFNNKCNLKELIECHGINLKDCKDNIEICQENLSLGKNFVNLSYEEKGNWIDELNLIIKNKNQEEFLNFIERNMSTNIKESHKELKCKDLVKFLGTCMEEYFCYILSALKCEGKIDEYIWSLETEKDKNNQIEVDLVVRNGYKLSIISVTLCEEEEECKSKLYESIIRGEQLGGDECLSIFACLYPNDEELYNYIKNINIEIKDRVKIIARNSFQDIKNKLEGWL